MKLKKEIKSVNFLYRLKENYKNLPNALTGLALGICGFSTVLNNFIYTFDAAWTFWLSISLMSIAIILLILAIIRNSLNPKLLAIEIKDPLLSSFLSTASMTLMCIAGFIAYWNVNQAISAAQIIGAIIMIFAIILQLLIFFYFVKNVLIKYKLKAETVYGSWFLPSVGLAIASLFANDFNNDILPSLFFQIIWYFAFTTYILFFFIVTYKLIFIRQKIDEKFPSIAIYFAPAGLITSSFIETFSIPYTKMINEKFSNINHLTFNSGLYYLTDYSFGYINAMSFILVAISFTYSIILWTIFIIKILRQKFSYIFASLTFPTAINAYAMLAYAIFLNDYIIKINDRSMLVNNIKESVLIIGYIFSIISCLLITYIAIRFIINLINDIHFKFNKNKLD